MEAAADIMNRQARWRSKRPAVQNRSYPVWFTRSMTPMRNSPVQAGRIREPGGGAGLFVW